MREPMFARCKECAGDVFLDDSLDCPICEDVTHWDCNRKHVVRCEDEPRSED